MMLFPDLALARRLKLHEAWSSSEHARTQARLYPETGGASQPLAEGCLVYLGAFIQDNFKSYLDSVERSIAATHS